MCSNPEVGQLRQSILANQDVVWLDVSVKESVAACDIEGGGYLGSDLCDP